MDESSSKYGFLFRSPESPSKYDILKHQCKLKIGSPKDIGKYQTTE